ncbi:MAG TPA: TlyA family RNA methyltransferase [Ktedonobacterales bacterium]|jgi:23S rRNA (cytidine1920-2'-O)/16S rRNA (cytidine1409-2'-O)-methyltransferase
MAASRKERVDQLLVQRGLAPSRERARALIMAGLVTVGGRVIDKAGTLVSVDTLCEVRDSRGELRYASRGGLKLERALDAFGLSPAGLTCLDVGASTGGFTDVLLQRGARLVYAVDVGQGQLAWELRNDPRVVVMERTNIRYLEHLPAPVQCAVIDVSFISLRLVLPRVAALTTPAAWMVALVKPQFEAGKAEADRGAGVISDPQVRRRVLLTLCDWAPAQTPPLFPSGLTTSPIAGRDGNREYLLWLEKQPGFGPGVDAAGIEQVIRREAQRS